MICMALAIRSKTSMLECLKFEVPRLKKWGKPVCSIKDCFFDQKSLGKGDIFLEKETLDILTLEAESRPKSRGQTEELQIPDVFIVCLLLERSV